MYQAHSGIFLETSYEENSAANFDELSLTSPAASKLAFR
jgi:hypothetical protein